MKTWNGISFGLETEGWYINCPYKGVYFKEWADWKSSITGIYYSNNGERTKLIQGESLEDEGTDYIYVVMKDYFLISYDAVPRGGDNTFVEVEANGYETIRLPIFSLS